jgi:hypothetical protein
MVKDSAAHGNAIFFPPITDASGYFGYVGYHHISYCGVFTSCKNRNLETCSRDYATVDEAVFSPCRVELCRVVPSRASPRNASSLVAINTWMRQEWGGVT